MEIKNIDWFTFDAFLLAERLHDIMPSLTAKYGHLAREAKERGNMEKVIALREKRDEIHEIYEALQINQDKEFVKSELEKYSLELNKLRGF